MNVLVINAGSSSLKYQLLNVDTREVYAKGNCERIGIDGSFVGHEEMGGEKQKLEVALPDHKTAIKYVFDILKTGNQPIDGIGHRVVQGGWSLPMRRLAGSAKLRHWLRFTTMPKPTSLRFVAKCSLKWAMLLSATLHSITTCRKKPIRMRFHVMWLRSCISVSTERMARLIAIFGVR